MHDECNWKTFFYDNKHDLRDVIDAIVMKHIKQKDIVKYLKKGEANEISFTYNRGDNVWELKHKTSPYIGQEFFPSDLTDFDYRGELIEDLDDEDLLDIISKYGKDVVAIEWSTRGYSQGDYIKGIAYATKEKYDNEVCDKEGDWKEDCAKIIDDEVKSIGMWMWGDVKGYVLEKKVAFTKKYKDESREDEDCEEWEEVDSCWGCYEETDELIKEVIKDHVLNELNIIVRPKNERCVCENRVPSRKDGLYLIYGNGHAEPFTGENIKENVRYIGLKHKDVSFAISLEEHDSVRLLDNDSRKESGSETYYERECDALFDIDGRGNTERLVARNPKLRNLLEDDEYIPSLGQLNLMAHHMDELNKAFAYVSASPLSSARYWSSTEYSKVSAWFVSFSNGGTHSNIEYNSYRVRAVIDF